MHNFYSKEEEEEEEDNLGWPRGNVKLTVKCLFVVEILLQNSVTSYIKRTHGTRDGKSFERKTTFECKFLRYQSRVLHE